MDKKSAKKGVFPDYIPEERYQPSENVQTPYYFYISRLGYRYFGLILMYVLFLSAAAFAMFKTN